MTNETILIIIISFTSIVNLTWLVLWYYRKSQSLEYRVERFIKKEKVKTRVHYKKHLSEDVMIQMFLRCGNENFRESIRQDFYRNKVLHLLDRHLAKDTDNKYIINGKAKFIVREAPKVKPLPEDEDMIFL